MLPVTVTVPRRLVWTLGCRDCYPQYSMILAVRTSQQSVGGSDNETLCEWAVLLNPVKHRV